MKKILFTGGTGFVGKNVLPILRENYIVDAPTRQELDLKDPTAVLNRLQQGKYDVVIHSANPNPVKNEKCDAANSMFEDSIRVFLNFYTCRHLCPKILHVGSGAEFDKTLEIACEKEEQVGRSVPADTYGCTKYVMNELSRGSDNIYNLRLFACYGPYDHPSKFITHVIRCCLDQREITIRQNCMFDYLHVYDLGHIMAKFIESTPKYHDYNIGSGFRISLYDIACEVKRQMGSQSPIVILKEGWNREYTPSIQRFENEFSMKDGFISLSDGIAMQITHEKEQRK